MSHNPTAITTLLLSADMQGSIVGRYPGSPAQGISYTSFGYAEGQHVLGFQLGFNGQRLEPNGLYLLGNGYRAYSTKLGRFCSQDSLSPFSRAGLNYYAYCLNDPINRNDPSGHFAEEIRKAISKTFRTNATKLRDRHAALNAIEAELRPLTTELLEDPLQASPKQRSKVKNLLARARKKSKSFTDIGGSNSSEFVKLYTLTKSIASTWNNSEIYQISRTTGGRRSNSIDHLTADYDSPVSEGKDDSPPLYSEVMAMNNNIRKPTS